MQLSPRQRWTLRLPSRPALGAAAFYAVLVLALGWPVPLHLRSLLLGHPGNDTWNHVWGFWWVFEELSSGRWPGWTRLVAWPKGGALFFIDTFNALLTLPFQALGGPVLAYNLTVLGALWFSAYAGWLLARHLVRDEAAALVAGVTYGLSPHLLAQAHNAITETLDAGFLALFALLLLRLLERPSPGRGLAAAASLVACGLTNWYYGLFAGILALLVLLHRALVSVTPVHWKGALRWGALGAGLFGPLAAGGLYLLARSMSAKDALVDRDPSFVWNSLLYHNITDLQCFFHPGRFYSPDLAALYGEDLVIVVYLGWVPLLLALWAVLRPHGDPRERWLWLAVALVFGTFALGPYLYAFGHYVELDGHRIPLPFLPLFQAVPVFSRISHPFRFVVGTELGLGVLAAGAVARLARRRRWGPWLGVAVALLALAETRFASPAPLPLAVSRATVPVAYAELRDDPLPGAVLDLPLAVPILERAVYNWYQVYHHRPIPYTLNEPVPPGLRLNQLARFLYRLEASRARLLPRRLPELELVLSSRILARQGYRYVAVHERFYPSFKLRKLRVVLDALLGPPIREQQGIVLYRLPPVAEP